MLKYLLRAAGRPAAPSTTPHRRAAAHPRPAPDAAAPPSPSPSQNWERLRSAPTARDQTLCRDGAAWLDALPAEVRPAHLAARFPRIVNRFALLWPDATLVAHYFDSLIIDQRGTRRGFPAEVMQELIQLRAWHAASAPTRSRMAALAMPPIDFD